VWVTGKVHKRLWGEPERWRALGKHKRNWDCSIKMDLSEIAWRAWTGLMWLRIETSGGLA
jgi:hypothetical protein